jgi:hypothetical protein
MSQISVKQLNLAHDFDFTGGVSLVTGNLLAIPTGADIRAVDAPSVGTDLTNKTYVDGEIASSVANAIQGLDIRKSVVAASTANLADLTDGTDAGYSMDGVTLVEGDRILLKDQTLGAANGIYVVGAAGVAGTRALDMNGAGEFAMTYFFVQEGTVNGSNGFVCVTHGAVTPGTTAVEFEQFSGAGQIAAGAALSKDGNQLDVEVDDSSIEVNADALRVKSGGITDAMLAGSITNAKLAGSIANGKLANSTISGRALGTDLLGLSATANGGISMTSYTGSAAVANVQLDFKARGGSYTVASGDTRTANVITEASIVVDHDLLASAHPLYGHVAVYRNGVLFGTRVIDGSTPNAAGEWALVDNGDNLDLKLFETTAQDFTGDEFKLSAMVQPV